MTISLFFLLTTHMLFDSTEWREIAAAGKPRQGSGRRRRRWRASARAAPALRDSDPRVAAAANRARETREAWRAAKGAASFAVDLEPGSAVFFNMALRA